MIKAGPSTYSLNSTFIVIEMADDGTNISLKNVKFWIADLLKLFQEQTQPDSETENGSKVKTKTDIISSIKPLCVVGVIVDIRNEKKDFLTNSSSSDANESNRPIVYDIDDGTGVITAVHFTKKRIAQQNSVYIPRAINCLEKSFPITKSREHFASGNVALSGIIQKTKKSVLQSRNSFAIGSCVEAKGCIQNFQDRPQLLAFSIREIDEPNLEMKQYIRIDHLKKTAYSKLFEEI